MSNLQYITDESGNRKAVLIPIQEWEEHRDEIEKLKRKIEVMSGIQDAVLEVKEVRAGRKKAKTLREML